MTLFTEPVLRRALTAACAERDLPVQNARLVHHYSNAVYVLPTVDVVVRLTTSRRTSQLLDVTQAAVAHLVHDHAFPATAPLDGCPPVRLPEGISASFWRYYPQPSAGRPFTSADLATLLHQFHTVSMPDAELPVWQPLTSLREELARDQPPHGLTPDEASWLRSTADDVAQQVLENTWALGIGPIHADAWTGNLLWDGDQPILGDWDNLAIGPGEVDLIPTWHAAVRYGRDHTWTRDFVDTYGYDLATDPSFDLLLRMRDLVQLTGPLRRAAESRQHLAVLRQRFDAIRADNRTARWVAL
ncbi:phosphotransferase [Myceligenerans indicum]|uniref:Phosphotransferase n=1 Tax=Myceligenerans indicum TaxID=2593663 RepID=A0ABS1LJP8_9MICO|nr:phosphotransferase [Myceligenerans indicum]MBL0886384.1 phosphotransferase [Myceligenerans indicum]